MNASGGSVSAFAVPLPLTTHDGFHRLSDNGSLRSMNRMLLAWTLVQCSAPIGTCALRLCPRGVVENPRHATRHGRGFRLAARPDPLRISTAWHRTLH
jgi:hypothetical protein